MSESALTRSDRGNPRRIATRCPHCASIARAQSKKVVTLTYDELYFQCSNILCGHTWKAALSFVHTISPSATPREGLNLPVYKRPQKSAPTPANDPAVYNIPTAANDGRSSRTG